MSVYNGMPYLAKAVNSILTQTFSDFELIVIDDASKDDSLRFLQSLNDSRLKIFSNELNVGMAQSLNKGLEIAGGEFVARLDADDVAYSTRLAEQLRFLDENPKVILCGSWAQIIDSQDFPISLWKMETEPAAIKWKLLFKNQFIHSSVVFRRSIVQHQGIRYREFHGVEDYMFWSELSRYGIVTNIERVLIQYRSHQESMTHYNAPLMQTAHFEVANENQRVLDNDVMISATTRLLTELRERKLSIPSFLLLCRLYLVFGRQNSTLTSREKLIIHQIFKKQLSAGKKSYQRIFYIIFFFFYRLFWKVF